MKFIISCSLLLIFITTFLSCCEDKVGARVIRASCTLRYEKYKFYELTIQPPQPPPPPPPLSSPSTNHTSSRGKTHISRTKIIIAIPITIAIFVLAFICTYLRLRARLQQL
ncbi:hypothetical protein P8452_43600 [Trifolium repens]|nr:putative receptor protein kinase [Trifolium repens]WJX58112.1 hypothetical protein P8452_43600 [Trifolium repens]